jgi:cell division protein FtsI/penicillin-binding protein 2
MVQRFLDGWRTGDLQGVAIESPTGESLAPSDVLAQIAALAGDLDPRHVQAQAAAPPQVDGGRATTTVNVEWTIVDDVVWPYQTTVGTHQVGGVWRVVFSPATVHPQLRAGGHLTAQPLPATRGSITDDADEPIVGERPVVTVGIQPGLVTDQAGLIAALGAALRSVGVSADLAGLPGRLAAADPGGFVAVVTLRREVYDAIGARIHDLPGVVLRDGTLPLAPTDQFAHALLGTVGEVTAAQLAASPGRYLAGEHVGQSALQSLYDDLLRGRPGVEISVNGSVEPLFHAEPRPGTVLHTTLDQAVQKAAESALAGQTHPAALVAVRVSDGAILAVANGPNGGEDNLAFTAQMPPGAAFTMVSALGLLDKGDLTPASPVACPRSFTVGGRTYTNPGGLDLGTVPLGTAFARSCDTAFAALAATLGPDGLSRAAASLGIGTTWSLGVPVFTGSVNANMSTVEATAAVLGQGSALVSPVCLAAGAATVARGAWRTPRLFPQLPPGAPAPTLGAAGEPPAEDAALGAQVPLAAMMRQTVSTGTAVALRDVAGPAVYAATSAATDPDAWAVGWRGDIAFTVLVEDSGGLTAVPIAAAFLQALH